MVTVVLSKYKRTHLFEEQLNAIKNQTIDISEILVCDNTVDNKGVWERFKLALKATNEFICILDDDTIPGLKFVENCLKQFSIKEGVYGTKGIIFKSNTHYKSNYTEHGWCVPNKETIKVDYVVHSWFFKKDWLNYFWDVDSIPFNFGEDMNLAFQMQKQGIGCYVPPHPIHDKELWGSLKGKEYGDDQNSLWVTNPNNFRDNMFTFFQQKVNEGWRLIRENSLM